MATLLLSAAGGAVGAGFGGTILGLSGAVIGRAVGAVLGQAIDQKLLGVGSQSVETGRVERLRLTSASEGEGVGIVWGRMRVAGQVIWSTRFFETTSVDKQGKGSSGSVTTTSYSYSVSLAVALCEGEILRMGRVWADGIEVEPGTLNMRVYIGSEDQLPDPKISAVEGADVAPAYRGIAYVVFEDLALAEYGNRVPQFTFEVVRAAQGAGIEEVPDLVRGVRGVAMIPGTGEYALATTPVYQTVSGGDEDDSTAANQNAAGGGTDFTQALTRLDEELPACGSVSLVVSWFGDDLRCNACRIRPMVESRDVEGRNMPWRAGGIGRGEAAELPKIGSGPVYGGTPSDQAVVEAIKALNASGKSVMFYPFILMDQMEGNTLPDPWSAAETQPVLPWRGRITLSVAPGRDESPDGTSTAEAEVAEFFGTAQPDDFHVENGVLKYDGPDEWSMRRFILHYAHLCVLAGGVNAFCIGTEMVALTQIRGVENSFPAVAAFRALAADVRQIVGSACKISYAADWSEYFGYQPGNGDRFFHLDPLWADENIDFVGIDNYMPLSDWRDGEDHLDAKDYGAIYDLDYLKSNIEGGEGYDWYYAAEEHREAQIRTPITDEAYDEPWLWRYKDIRNWWASEHRERVNGIRSGVATDWEPCSKPIWFTELGCAAVNNGTNQPNKFLDPKSSESTLPYYSDGRRDELIQMQYLRAVLSYWADGANNPVSDVYAGRMIEVARSHVWCWDSRPYPTFPNRSDLWSDSENYAKGHWISGRAVSQPLSSVVAEICHRAGVIHVDVSALYGLVRGYVMAGGTSGRSALQSLMLAYGFEALERDGALVFRMRDGRSKIELDEEELVYTDAEAVFETVRSAQAETTGRVRLLYVEADGDFETATVEAIFPDEADGAASGTEISLAMTRAQAQATAERWLAEARVARDTAKFTLPPSIGAVGTGDVVTLGQRRYRVDRAERGDGITIEAVRVEPGVYQASDEAEEAVSQVPFVAPVPVTPVFLDLPLMTGSEDPTSPYLAVAAVPWPGKVAVYSASEDAGYSLQELISRRASMGRTLSPLIRAPVGRWDRGEPLRVRLRTGSLASASRQRVLNGANLIAIGDGSSDTWEILQFSEAAAVETQVWDLSLRLRGQFGSDAHMPDVWPSGSRVVLLDSALSQIVLSASTRGLARHYRIGSAGRSYDDPSYVHKIEAFRGEGLRPYRPCHVSARSSGGGWTFGWTRRTRLDGDSWEGYDVPLGETQERYLLRVMNGGSIVREVTSNMPEWTYSAAAISADGTGAGFELRVAQLSDSYGPGPYTSLAVGG